MPTVLLQAKLASYYVFEWCAEGVEHAMLQSMSVLTNNIIPSIQSMNLFNPFYYQLVWSPGVEIAD